MNLIDFNTAALLPGLGLLPPDFNTRESRAMLMAVALQESAMKHRKQHMGPARGYYQFERIGVHGVLAHPKTTYYAKQVCGRLDIEPVPASILKALEFNDLLATVFARLVLFPIPSPLPNHKQQAEGWRQYLAAWRPGRPRPETWQASWMAAWRAIEPVIFPKTPFTITED